MRVAYFSPLPPRRSGISDYSAELLPHLAEHVELELFVDDGDESRTEVAGAFPVHSYRRFRELAAGGRYDVTLYHVGNNPDYHGYIYETLRAHPGVVVLHEYMLHHLIQGITTARGNPARYWEEMRYAYGASGEALARRSSDTGLPLNVWSYPLFERVVDSSLGLIVHNDCVKRRVLASRPGTPIATVPHHLSLDALPRVDAGELGRFRERWDIDRDAVLVASFGFITPAKRLEVALRAFRRLRRQHPEAIYLLAGEVSPYYDLDHLLGRELAEGVVVTGRLPLAELLTAMAACDVAVNLRYPTGGETSGTLIRLLGLGKPVIVSDAGAFAEVPTGAAARVPLDEREDELLLAYLEALVSDQRLRRSMGANARDHMARHHRLADSAAGYAEFLRRVVAEAPAPFEAVPPLAAFPADDLSSALVGEVSAAMVDVCGADPEPELRREVADALVELELDRRGRTA